MKKIGITMHIEHARNHVENAINMQYVRAVINAGGLPILVPVTLDFGMLDDYLNLVEGMIFTGGCDINPERYNEKNDGLSVDICDIRDQMELYLLNKAIKQAVPVLGICRGHQLINIHYGGTLFQDVMTQYNTEIDHINLEGEADHLAHGVKLDVNSRLKQWLRVDKFKVNSRHHQAIKRLGEGLAVAGRSRDGIVEAIEHVSDDVIGVQWHPEDIFDLQPDLFIAFIEHCGRAVSEEAKNHVSKA